ncbi:fructosamine kinase family protein [Actinokineospora inagensis]|uniref:fructosamine kinase family protein n=1 Tax=Actinokineospora inagensis TaxID=103730 RepID=UPI0003F69342|nr:fructosamine kinase family protein [Actinokineospora inagensis]
MGAGELTDAVAALTGGSVTGVHALKDHVFEVDTDDGDLVVVKHDPRPNAIEAEVAGLIWLTEPAAVAVPHVRAHDDQWLIMEQVEPAPPTTRAAEDFGRGLADLHAAGADGFGASTGPEQAWIGLAPMRCSASPTWADWYVRDRIEPYLRGAANRGLIDGAGVATIETVCNRVDAPVEPPARLHGDLWSGNVLWAGDRVWLIDPAAHGGHRETDLAMLALFGCPHLDRIVGAYHEHRPLADGWRERIPLHQLFPLLVHTVLFGSGYARQTVSAAQAALRC